jgi:hypothetical protein
LRALLTDWVGSNKTTLLFLYIGKTSISQTNTLRLFFPYFSSPFSTRLHGTRL